LIDIAKPEAPRIAATFPLINSIVGPPTNLAIHPSGEIAFVANSLEPVIQGWGHRLEPDTGTLTHRRTCKIVLSAQMVPIGGSFSIHSRCWADK
jgi:hypothetical protein